MTYRVLTSFPSYYPTPARNSMALLLIRLQPKCLLLGFPSTWPHSVLPTTLEQRVWNVPCTLFSDQDSSRRTPLCLQKQWNSISESSSSGCLDTSTSSIITFSPSFLSYTSWIPDKRNFWNFSFVPCSFLHLLLIMLSLSLGFSSTLILRNHCVQDIVEHDISMPLQSNMGDVETIIQGALIK